MVSRSSTNSTSSLDTRTSVMIWESRMVFSRVSRIGWSWVFPFVPLRRTRAAGEKLVSSENQFPLTCQLALHLFVHFLIGSARATHIVGILGQNLANFFIQAILNANFVLDRRPYLFRQRIGGRRLDHFRRNPPLHKLTRHVPKVNPGKQHRVRTPKNLKKKGSCPGEEVSRKVRPKCKQQGHSVRL